MRSWNPFETPMIRAKATGACQDLASRLNLYPLHKVLFLIRHYIQHIDIAVNKMFVSRHTLLLSEIYMLCPNKRSSMYKSMLDVQPLIRLLMNHENNVNIDADWISSGAACRMQWRQCLVHLDMVQPPSIPKKLKRPTG